MAKKCLFFFRPWSCITIFVGMIFMWKIIFVNKDIGVCREMKQSATKNAENLKNKEVEQINVFLEFGGNCSF